MEATRTQHPVSRQVGQASTDSVIQILVTVLDRSRSLDYSDKHQLLASSWSEGSVVRGRQLHSLALVSVCDFLPLVSYLSNVHDGLGP